jgi:3-methylfumaryl-CoA hydratase
MSQLPWAEWVGRTETVLDNVSPMPARAMTATFGRDPANPCAPGAELPPLETWLHFLPLALMGEIGPGGHPPRGRVLPPIQLQRRIWVDSRCAFFGPVRIGETICKASTIVKVAEKTDSAGMLTFVTVRHDIAGEASLQRRCRISTRARRASLAN